MKREMRSSALLGLLAWCSAIALTSADSIPITPAPTVDQQLTALEEAVGQLKERIGCLTEENAVLQDDLANHQHPKPWPVHPPVINNYYTGRNDCCLLDVIRADCEKKIAGLGVCRLGNGAYYFSPQVPANGVGSTWWEASDFCRQRGMELASVETVVENALLVSRVAQLVGLPGALNVPFFWFSLNDQNINGNYVWYGTGQSAATFTDWHPGSPTNTVAEACAGIFKSNIPANLLTKWDDRACNIRYRWICELSQPCLDLVNIKSCPPVTGVITPASDILDSVV